MFDETSIFEKVQNRELKVGVIGLGYVGLPLSLAFAEKGFRVFGFDVDMNKIKMLSEGKSYFRHIPSEKIKAVALKNFFPQYYFSRLSEVDVIIICVPTPLTKYRDPDLRFVIETANTVAEYLVNDQLVVLESTSYPGTTREVIKPILENGTQMVAGRDFFLGFSSEREDPGNEKFKTVDIPKVISGLTPECSKYMKHVYSAVFDRGVEASSLESAELSKVFENTYRCVNIALVNEMKMLCARMGINVWEVIRLASTKPFGFQPFYPGPGLGGHCIPIDPFYLTWKAKQFGMDTKFIELAGEINSSMPTYVTHTIAGALNDEKKSLNGSKILVVGVAYKPDIDDIRESPAIEIIQDLQRAGANIFYHDPYIPKIRPTRKWDLSLESIPLLEDHFMTIKFDCAVVVTNHKNIDYDFLLKNVPIIVDSRNSFSSIPANCSCKVYQA